jgi:hypothetical protein
MPYSRGEPPQSGDRVKRNDDGSFATVIAVERDHPEIGRDRITVKWDLDEISFTDQAEAWTLMRRG